VVEHRDGRAFADEQQGYAQVRDDVALHARSALAAFEDAVFRAFARWNPIPLPASYPAASVQLTVTFFFNETAP
jgi:hypothetical protein